MPHTSTHSVVRYPRLRSDVNALESREHSPALVDGAREGDAEPFYGVSLRRHGRASDDTKRDVSGVLAHRSARERTLAADVGKTLTEGG